MPTPTEAQRSFNGGQQKSDAQIAREKASREAARLARANNRPSAKVAECDGPESIGACDECGRPGYVCGTDGRCRFCRAKDAR